MTLLIQPLSHIPRREFNVFGVKTMTASAYSLLGTLRMMLIDIDCMNNCMSLPDPRTEGR